MIDLAGLPDLQNAPDGRKMPINKVGIKNLRHPWRVADRDGRVQPTIATVNMYVALAEHLKGTHMSRFVELLNRSTETLQVTALDGLLAQMQTRLHARSAFIEIRFPYFRTIAAPVSGQTALLDYQVALIAERTDHTTQVQIEVTGAVTTLCPCSKEISDYGAHNQRSAVTIRLQTGGATVWIDDLIDLIARSGSCPIFPLLKRPDEKWVTEHAYDHPKFVEDVVRDIAVELLADGRVIAFTVECENYESIHNHNAYAIIERSKGADRAERVLPAATNGYHPADPLHHSPVLHPVVGVAVGS